MLLFYWSTAAALVSFSYAISTLFASTRVASLLCPLIYLLSMVPAFLAVSSQVLALTWCQCACFVASVGAISQCPSAL